MGFRHSKNLDIECTIDKLIIINNSLCKYTANTYYDSINFYEDHFVLGYSKIMYKNSQINDDGSIIYAKIKEQPENSIFTYVTFYTIKLNPSTIELFKKNYLNKFNAEPKSISNITTFAYSVEN